MPTTYAQVDLFAEPVDDTAEHAARDARAEETAARLVATKRAARLARETAELAKRAEDAARILAERRARPDVAEWRARFERAPYTPHAAQRADLAGTSGWVCPSCGRNEPNEGALEREHGYDPDTVGRIPYAAGGEFGAAGQCHSARLRARQAEGRDAHNATREPGQERTYEIDGHPLVHTVPREPASRERRACRGGRVPAGRPNRKRETKP